MRVYPSRVTLQRLFTFNEVDGTFTRNITVSGNGKKGDIIKGPFVRIKWVAYPLHRLIFIYMIGECPRLIGFVDGNNRNTRWSNLKDITPDPQEGKIRKEYPTQSELKCMFDYDASTGYFSRRTQVPGGASPGTVLKGSVVTIDSIGYKIHRLIFIYMTGLCPYFVEWVDGDKKNIKWNNLKEKGVWILER